MRLRQLRWPGLLLLALVHGAGFAQAPTPRVRVTDLTGNFVAFYNAANAPGVDAEKRFALWQQHYGFAAVPAGENGQVLARALLDQAWPRYAAAMDRIIVGYGGMRPSPENQLHAAAELLKLDRPLKLHVLAYVGMFEGNAFTQVSNGEVTVALPVEDPPDHRAVSAAHELTHAVQIALGTLPGADAPLASLVMAEGLAMHASRELVPGGKPERYVELEPGWLAAARKREAAVLRSVRAALASTDPETIHQHLMDRGPSGLTREGYYAGWRIVEQWRADGRSFAQIARIPPGQQVAEVDAVISRLLSQAPAKPPAKKKP
ncbi:DUF2268 domain-containing putative Zn-dependent protease [Niveibacterium sp. SC-1]|uniref:DUF2268 domain-containing putative Zn-dependent protease n=1 Tax=Niveibacterium sp. SC-1 TaxID=3135646 RepID=UPI00311F4496